MKHTTDNPYTEEGCLIHDHHSKRKKYSGAVLLVLAVVLFLAGMAAFFIPILITEMEIAQDAEEYVAWREKFTDIIEPITTVTDMLCCFWGRKQRMWSTVPFVKR